MLKPVLGVAAAGVIGLLLWKIALVVLLPLLGVAVATVFAVLKIGFAVAMVFLAIWLFRRWSRDEATTS